MLTTENTAGRKILVPRSPRRSSRSPTPRDGELGSTETAHGTSSPSSSLTSASDPVNEPQAGIGDDQTVVGSHSQDGECGIISREESGDLPVSRGANDQIANSEPEAAWDKSDDANSVNQTLLTPSISIDSADIPLPSTETEDDLADHPLSPSTPQRSSFSQSPEDRLTITGQNGDPVTVRDLANATPTPSPAPISEIGKEVDYGPVAAEFDPPGLVPASSIMPSDKIPENQEQPGLIMAAEVSEDEDSDFLDDLAGLQIEDQYDARSTEPLPDSPFSNSLFQESLKRGISLAKAIVRSMTDVSLLQRRTPSCICYVNAHLV